ncbi:uncharacterized protein LOC123475756 [Daphnia magna]|nr:uncharacterized protein LOC123475756 [Daphnia magna]
MQLNVKTRTKSLQFRDKTVYLCLNCKVFGSTLLDSLHENETLAQQFERVIRDFDEAQICPGVTEEKFRKIKFCAGAFLQEEVWRSVDCKLVYNGTDQECCADCYTIKRALGRLMSKSLSTMSDEDKLQKLKNDYRLAMKRLTEKVRRSRKWKRRSLQWRPKNTCLNWKNR